MPTITEQIVKKVEHRSWKTLLGTGLNAASIPLLSMPELSLKIAGVLCLAIGSALLAWDDSATKKEVKDDKKK